MYTVEEKIKEFIEDLKFLIDDYDGSENTIFENNTGYRCAVCNVGMSDYKDLCDCLIPENDDVDVDVDVDDFKATNYEKDLDEANCVEPLIEEKENFLESIKELVRKFENNLNISLNP